MPEALTHRLSKSRVVAGAQCDKRLWWRVHEPDAPELQPDSVHQAVFDAGDRVGKAAQDLFDGGVEIPFRPDLAGMVRETKDAMQGDAPAIFEAAFIHEGIFVAVDVLERGPNGWTLIEVKSTKSVKAHHILDAAVQAYVVQACGVDVAGIELMHLTRRFTETGELFERADILDLVEEALPDLPHLVSRLGSVLAGPIPDTPVGTHCRQPRTCEFLERCIPAPEADATARLYRIPKKTLNHLLELGHNTVHTIPSDYPLRPIADRQRRALVSGSMVIDKGMLRELDKIVYPAAFIDFESIAPAIPPFPGCEPYAQIPVQVSAHQVDADGAVTHFEWLADSGVDPRPELAKAVLRATQGAHTLVAYSAGFEKQMIRHLMQHVGPKEAAALSALCDQFFDLLPLMRNFVYHPDFGGRFGLKAVTKALLPSLSYDDLEVQAGGDASVRLADLIVRGIPREPVERDRLRRNLLAYCKRDTETMVALVHRLRSAPEAQ